MNLMTGAEILRQVREKRGKLVRSLDRIGEGDWTPQDQRAAELAIATAALDGCVLLTAEEAEQVRLGGHFYLSHKMREYQHPNAPEITMAEHVPGQACPACDALALLTPKEPS